MTKDELIQVIESHGNLSAGVLADSILAMFPRWIPVAEEKPVISGEYLVTDASGNVFIAEWYKSRHSKDYAFYIDPGTFDADKLQNIKAWANINDLDAFLNRPLPPEQGPQ